jgi:hypothetical protein
MATESERLLHIYLADHWAGAGGGVALAKRIAKENSDNEIGREMADIAMAIEEDQAALERLMARLGARRRTWRKIGAQIGELTARLKPNGKLVGYSPLSRVLELEAMIMGVSGKLELWRALLELGATDPSLDPPELERLHGRAEDQRRRLEQLHGRAAAQAFRR